MPVLSSDGPVQFYTAKDAVYIDATEGRVIMTPNEARELAAEIVARAEAAERWGLEPSP